MATLSDRPPRGRRRALGHRLLLAFGATSVALLVGTVFWRQQTTVQDLAYLQAVGEIQSSVAISHLWIEEHVSGDEVDLPEIRRQLDHALALAATLAAAPAEPVLPDLSPLPEPLLQRARLLLGFLEQFQELTLQRQQSFATGGEVGIGSAFDRRYDGLFDAILAFCRELQAALEQRRGRRHRHAQLIFGGIVAAWGAVILAAAAALRSRERRRRQTESALVESQAQVFQLQKMEAVGRLAGGIAHDLNNFLAALRGHCELVKMKRPPQDPVRVRMEAAIRIIFRASTLIERLLTFARVRTVKSEVVDLNRVVGGLRKVLEPTVTEKIELQLHLAPERCHVEVPPAHLDQLLVNLTVNSREALEGGGFIRIETAVVRRPPPGGSEPEEYVRLTVEDNGKGIPPELRETLFEPFVTSKVGRGNTGLGLSVVYGVVREAGGFIELSSEPGEGTAFQLFLPRTEREATVEEGGAEVDLAAFGGDETILLVDDNRELRGVAREVLAELGYRVLEAGSGEEALALVEGEEEGFDLLVTDIVLPGINGRQLADRLCGEGSDRVLFISGYAEEVAALHGVHLQEVSFFNKLSPMAELVRLVRGALDGLSQPAARPRGDAP